MNRRRFLARGAAALGVTVAGAAHAQAPAPDDPSKVLGGPKRPYGDRSRFERTA